MKFNKAILNLINNIKKLKILSLLFWLLLILAGSIYVRYIWIISMESVTDQALKLAESAEASIQKEALSKLKTNAEDIDKSEYKQIKDSLMKLVKINSNIRFAYIYKRIDGKIYFIADSEAPDSEAYSPPGQVYTEASETTVKPYEDGKTLITKPEADRWGTWVSVLVPMKDFETGEVLAVFGIDYPAEMWSRHAVTRTLQACVVVFCLFLLIIAFNRSLKRNADLRAEKNKLALFIKEKEKIEGVLRRAQSIAHVGNWELDIDSKQVQASDEAFRIYGIEKTESIALEAIKKVPYMEERPKLDMAMKLLLEGKEKYDLEFKIKRVENGEERVIYSNSILEYDKNNNPCKVIGIIQDITERVKAENELRESERSKSVLLSNLPGMAYRCSFDRDYTMHFVSDGCYELTGYKPESLLENADLTFNELIVPEYRDVLWDIWNQTLSSRTVFREEYQIITASGKLKWVFEQGRGIYDKNGEIEAIEGLIIDITDRKIKEQEILYLNEHDYLTGLYNRSIFEKEKHRLDNESQLPLSIIIGDINGVKFINDAFGHVVGDKLIIKTAEILKSCCKEGDVLARTGGNEFRLLLPKSDNKTAAEIFEKIKGICEEYNSNTSNEAYCINLSLGYSTKTTLKENINEIIKSAEDNMYRSKLLDHKSSHSAILSSIKATMFERSQETEAHAERLTELSKKVGINFNISQIDHDNLKLLSTLHDIGKVGIDDRILNKPGKLSDDEWVEMKKHPEIGYRIAIASQELTSIAEYILCHHERWDGSGYPNGLRGESIPLLSRILAVVDAYDAMTEDRIYRKAMTDNAAVEELRKNAGTQFDPNIVNIFIEKVINGN